MSISAAALQTLHRIHGQLADLRARLERGPKRVAGSKANVAKVEADLQAARETVKQTRLAADKKQLDLKAAEERIANWRVQLNTAASNKEYQQLQEQIAAAEMATSVQADEILEMLERVDELTRGVADIETLLSKGRDELEKTIATVQADAETIRGEIERLEAELAVAEQEVPGDFKTEYRRLIDAKGAEGLSEAEDGVCIACGQKMTLNMQSDLALSKPTFCKSCGCLLYLPE
ncbi:MAG: phospholipase [Planctomycetota bacterium]